VGREGVVKWLLEQDDAAVDGSSTTVQSDHEAAKITTFLDI
jgi:hypothetical protein